MKNRHTAISRILSLLLIVSAVAVCFLSCAETPDAKVTPTPTEKAGNEPEATPTSEIRLTPDIPATYDFDGSAVNFLYWNVAGWENTVRYCRDITCDDYSGDRVSAAVYQRNAVIEENYKVKITVDIQAHDRIDTIINNENATGDQYYQVTVPRAWEAAGMVAKGYFLNFYDIPYVNLEQPWWDRDCISQLTSNDVLYLITSSLLVNDKDATAALVFSKKAVQDMNLGDFYALVANGEWTYETVADLAQTANCDKNGDEKMTEEDFWGFMGQNDVAVAFYHGSGNLFVGKDESDRYALEFGTTDDSVDAAQAALDFTHNEWFYNGHVTSVSDDYMADLFESDHALFFWVRLDKITNMRDSEIDFGILPTPKYASDREDYHSTVSQHTTGMLSIPKSNSGDALDRTGMILEALSAESMYTLQPAYIEDSLKTRYSRDAESQGMLDIILSSRVFDPGCIFGFGNLADGYLYLAQNKGAQVASFIETKSMAVETAIERFNEDIADLAD